MKFETLNIRWLIRKDLPAAVAIEKDCFGELAWSEEEFTRQLKERKTIGLVAETEAEALAGYVIYRVEQNSLRIISLGVCLNYRFEGVGRKLVEHLISKLHCKRRSMIRCVIRETNLDAQLFFRAMGFEAIRTIKRPFFELDEDGYEFRYLAGQPVCDTRILCEELLEAST